MRRFRFTTYVLVLVLTLAVYVPSLAFAESSGGGDFDSDPGLLEPPWNTIIYGPNRSTDFGADGDLGGTVRVEVGVCAASRYDAALVALGYNGTLSADDKARLSNSSTGGEFWTFAQKFNNPTNDAMDLVQLYWMGLNALYGTGNVWRGTYTDYEANLATDALHRILNGGGGGGSGETDDEVEINGYKFKKCFYGQKLGDYYYELESKITSETVNFYVSNSQYRQWIDDNDDNGILCLSNKSTTGTQAYNFAVVALQPNVGLYYYEGSNPRALYLINTSDEPVTLNYRYYASFVSSANNNIVNIDYPGGNSATYRLPAKSYVRVSQFGIDGEFVFNRNSESENPVVPPSNWPSAPESTQPTAPDVPEPSEPERPVQPVNPSAPTLPDFPSNVISPGSTYETFDIQAILDAMDEHCRHLQSAIYQGFADYFDTFTTWLDERLETLQACIRGESVWQIQRIDADFDSLKDYLHDLFEWLADQMQFTFTGDSYNDSTVVSWLRRIYFKLQSSPVNTRPADPVANPDGAWDWLWQLLQDILTGLTGGAAELVGKLMTLFDGIRDKFPFSVPWDLAAVLALLDVPAQTPAFVVSYDVFGTTVTYDIDMHFMDEYAGVIRSMESVLFCFMLIKNTKWLTGIFDEVGQFLGTKLGYRG